MRPWMIRVNGKDKLIDKYFFPLQATFIPFGTHHPKAKNSGKYLLGDNA